MAAPPVHRHDHAAHDDAHDHAAHDHAARDHSARDHSAHDHSARDHSARDHGSNDHGSNDHGSHDHGSHDHASHDHASHDHPARDHSSRDHTAHDHGSHGHSAHHHHGPVTHDRAFAVGIALNLAFVAIEAWWGWRVDSLALLADAAHNLSDVAGLVLAWGGAFAGRLRPDARYTYGWRRASIVAAFFNALLLLVAMGSLALEAVQRLSAPQPVQGLPIIVVAAIGIVVNGATALLFMRGSEHDLNLRGAFVHMAADALVSLGVVVAGALALVYGWTRVDPVTSLVVAAVIVAGTWGLFRQSLRLMFDGVPEHLSLTEVRDSLASMPGVAQVDDLHVWAMGTTQTALTAHLVMPQGADDAFLKRATCMLEECHGIAHVTLQVARSPMGLDCAAVAARGARRERPPASAQRQPSNEHERAE